MLLTIAVAAVPNGCVAIDSDKMFSSAESAASFDALMAGSPALAYIVDYGWKQSLGDATAMTKEKKATMTPSGYLGLVEKKRDAIFAGKVQARGVSSGPVDPIHAEAVKLAKARWVKKTDDERKVIIAAFRASYFAGKPAADATDEKVIVFVLLQMAAGLRDEAERNLAAGQAVAVDEATVAAAKAILADLLAPPKADEADDDDDDEADDDDESEEAA